MRSYFTTDQIGCRVAAAWRSNGSAIELFGKQLQLKRAADDGRDRESDRTISLSNLHTNIKTITSNLHLEDGASQSHSCCGSRTTTYPATESEVYLDPSADNFPIFVLVQCGRNWHRPLCCCDSSPLYSIYIVI